MSSSDAAKSEGTAEDASFDRDSPDVLLCREVTASLYKKGEALTIDPRRWERVRGEVIFSEVVSLLAKTPSYGHAINCPFHGRDSRPSFVLYPISNDAYCFGCPVGQQYYDAITFVSKFLAVSRVKALKWLEKTYQLPVIEDIKEVLTASVSITFSDLASRYIAVVGREARKEKSVVLTEEYLRTYFRAEMLSSSEDKEIEAALMLAQVIGPEHLKSAKLKVFNNVQRTKR